MGTERRTVLIFGATGMLGRELHLEAHNRGFKSIGASRHGPDVFVDVCNKEKVQDIITTSRPEIIINSAAIVSHTLCETNPSLAYDVNARAVEFIGSAAKKTGSQLVQISTDHFFSGDGPALHDEEAPVKLLNEYAKTKYEGEIFALGYSDALVIRTNITGFRNSGGVVSFIEWVIESLNSDEEFNLFSDYYTSTISTRQASTALFDLLNHEISGKINLACREVASKEEFVKAIAMRMGKNIDHARLISVHDVLSARAESVGLDVSRAENVLGYQLPNLEEVVRQLVSECPTRVLSDNTSPQS